MKVHGEKNIIIFASSFRGISCVSGLDNRELTKKIREKGTMIGKVTEDTNPMLKSDGFPKK